MITKTVHFDDRPTLTEIYPPKYLCLLNGIDSENCHGLLSKLGYKVEWCPDRGLFVGLSAQGG